MRKMLLAALLAAFTLMAAGSALAGTRNQPDRVYQRYAIVRDQVRACVLDKTFRHLGQEKRRSCRTYRKLYLLYALPGAGESTLVLKCLTRRCPRAPLGVVDPRAPVPRGAAVYRP